VSLVILTPVLARPHRVEPLLESIRETTPEPYRVLFICDPSDTAEREAVAKADAEELTVGGSWARKVNVGVTATSERLIFAGADDLNFRAGWFEAAKRRIEEGAQVVGVNDLIRRRRDHATHFLMTRSYAQRPTIDGRRGPCFEGYSGWYVDDELIATARKRDCYAYAQDSHVEHLHPSARKAPDDATYRKARGFIRQDKRRFERREPLWT
jgi:hypothetical protein